MMNYSRPEEEKPIQDFIFKYTGKKIEEGTTIWSVLVLIIEAIEAKDKKENEK